MAISLGGFSGGGGGASTDTLDDVTGRGATTTNAITVGGVSVGAAYSLPTVDGSANQVLQTNGSGSISFQTLDFTGGLEYKGAFNATAGTPSLLNAEKGDFYIIDTAGTIYGQTWAVGDHLLINEDMGGSITNSKIDKIDNTQAVTSVNTQTGAVVLSGNDLLADHTAVHYIAANNNIDGHLSGIDTKLGTVASPTLDDVTTNGATTTNAINVGTITTSGDILANTDASRTIGAEATRFITYHGDMNGAIRFKAKNNQGSAISKGQVVYISGVSGTVPEVKLAQANSAATMPAFGLALANANDQAEVQIITFGNLTDYNTTTYSLSANDTVFVSATTAGALTNSAPTGESNLIQNIGRVVRADASAGIIKVGGAGRSNATPNLDQDKVFLGNASNQSVSTALSAIGLSKFNNDSNFLTNINNESLNDLSDVSYTAGSSIDNYVLTYDHSTTSWGAEAAASGGYPVQTATSSATADLNSAVYLTAASATACTVTLPATSGATDGDAVIIVRRSPGSLTIQQNGADSGTLVTYLDQGNASSHTITNNQQQIHVRYDSSGTRWYIYDKAQALVATSGDYDDLSNLPTLGTAAALDVGTTADKVVQLNSSAQLPQVDGSLLTNVGKFIDYELAAFNTNMAKNTGYRLTANSLTLTLPARSTLSDGDYFAITAGVAYSVSVALNAADSGTSNIFYNVASNSHSTTSHTLSINKQEIFIRFNGTSFFITSETKLSELSGDSSPVLGGDLDLLTYDIVSSSNRNIEFSANGTGVVKVKPTTSGGHLELDGDGTNVGKLRLMCEQSSHGIYLTGPSHAAAASYTLKFPDTAGTANYVLKTDGSGNLDWVAQASGGGNPPTVTSASPSANYTISTHADNEEVYLLNPSTDISVFLPAASTCGSGYKYQIKNLSANNLTIDPNGSEYIDYSGQTTYAIDQQYTNITLVTDGSNWFII